MLAGSSVVRRLSQDSPQNARMGPIRSAWSSSACTSAVGSALAWPHQTPLPGARYGERSIIGLPAAPGRPSHHGPAVDREHLAGDVGGCVGGHEYEAARDLLRAGPAPPRAPG